MNVIRIPVCAATVLFVLSLPFAAVAQPADREAKEQAREQKKLQDAASERAAVAALGSQVPPATAAAFASAFRVGDQSLFDVLSASGGATQASGLEIDYVTVRFGPLKMTNSRVSLTPAADGRSCRFEVSGAPFGDGSTLEVSGTVEWKAGPLGGDKLDIVFALGNAPVEAVRTFLPQRIDPSFHGLVSVTGKASGIVNEKTTEDAPATPLRGDVEVKLDWQILGRTAPVVITTPFSLDDRMMRLSNGHIRWRDYDLLLKGWFDPYVLGEMEIFGIFKDVDANKVAVDWNVPPPWRPTATVSGTFSLTGTPGKSMLRYEARAPSIDVPLLGGYNVHMNNTKIVGSLLAINADASASFMPESWTVAGVSMESLPSGILWFRNKVMYNASNSKLWGGDNDITISYKPEEHPAFSVGGRLAGADAKTMISRLVPWLGLAVEGGGNIAYDFGQDAERKPRWTVHGSLVAARIANVDLFGRTLDALAAADASIRTGEITADIPRPNRGEGMRVDQAFLEIEKTGDVFAIGGMKVRAGEFQLDADGEISEAAGVKLDGTVAIPAASADKLVASSPWLASLRGTGGPLFVPVVITGPPATPTIALGPGYAELLASAKRGDAVTAPVAKKPRHVGEKEIAGIPGSPNYVDP